MMIALGLLLAIQPAPDPLAPARSGQVQCFQPDHARKTCNGIAVYRLTGDDRYSVRTTSFVEETGDLVVESEAPVRIARGAACATLMPANIEGARYRRGGVVLSDDEARPIMARLEAPVWTLFGKEFCTRYATIGGGLVAIVDIDGAATSQIAQRVAWVGPNDGYRVAR